MSLYIDNDKDKDTCTFLGTARSLAMHAQFTAKVFLPELSKPYVPAVIGQRATLEVTVKCYQKKENIIKIRISFKTSWKSGQVKVVSGLTIHRCPLRKDGDGAFGYPLLLDYRRDLGPPAVGSHPQEVTCQIVAFCCIQDSPFSITGDGWDSQRGEEGANSHSIFYSYVAWTCSVKRHQESIRTRHTQPKHHKTRRCRSFMLDA